MNAGLSEAPAADNRIVLHGLRSEEYEHSFDRQALRALKSTPGFEFLVRKLNEYSMDRLNRIRYTGSNIKLNAQVMPEIHNILFRACEILDMQFVPEMYVAWSYNVNAFTAGVERPIVVVTSGAVDLLTHEELAFLIGHELGHIKSGHVLYHQMADILPLLGSIVASATLGIGGLVSTGIQLALLNWDRMSEFTADRAGLLVCQNATTAGPSRVSLTKRGSSKDTTTTRSTGSRRFSAPCHWDTRGPFCAPRRCLSGLTPANMQP